MTNAIRLTTHSHMGLSPGALAKITHPSLTILITCHLTFPLEKPKQLGCNICVCSKVRSCLPSVPLPSLVTLHSCFCTLIQKSIAHSDGLDSDSADAGDVSMPFPMILCHLPQGTLVRMSNKDMALSAKHLMCTQGPGMELYLEPSQKAEHDCPCLLF